MHFAMSPVCITCRPNSNFLATTRGTHFPPQSCVFLLKSIWSPQQCVVKYPQVFVFPLISHTKWAYWMGTKQKVTDVWVIFRNTSFLWLCIIITRSDLTNLENHPLSAVHAISAQFLEAVSRIRYSLRTINTNFPQWVFVLTCCVDRLAYTFRRCRQFC
jgi:hypothetical protein